MRSNNSRMSHRPSTRVQKRLVLVEVQTQVPGNGGGWKAMPRQHLKDNVTGEWRG